MAEPLSAQNARKRSFHHRYSEKCVLAVIQRSFGSLTPNRE